MNRKISQKTIYILIGVFIFAVFTAFVGMRTYFHWTSAQYFGEIIEIKEGGFAIKIDGGSKMLILTNQNTDIRKGRKIWAEQLQVGDFVIVVGSINQEGFIEARAIRIVAPLHPSL